MAAQPILVQRGGEDSPRCVVDRHAERAWVDLDERLGAVCAVSPMSGSESAGSGGLGGVAVGHGGATYVGGGSSKEGVGGYYVTNSFDLSSSASPARMGRGGWIRSYHSAERLLYGGERVECQGNRGRSTVDHRRNGGEGGQTIELNAGRTER